MEVRARIVFETEAKGSFLRDLAAECGLSVQRVCSIADPDALMRLNDVSLLLLEQCDAPLDRVQARVYTLASANPDLLVAVLVRHPRTDYDAELLRAHAFDVLDDGPDLKTNLQHM